MEDQDQEKPNIGLDFGAALYHLKRGRKVARTGWNGKGMHVFLNPSSDITVSEGRPLAKSFPIGTPIHCREYLMMYTAQGDIVPWVASQTDLLAEDWELVEPPHKPEAIEPID